MNSPNRPIPWYRVHLVTCVAMMIVGAALLWIQTMFSASSVITSSAWWGWPLGYSDAYDVSRLPNFNYSSLEVWVDIIVAVILIFGTGFLFELLIRRITSRLHFSLSAVLVVVIAAAIMLGERYANWNMYALAERMGFRPSLLSGYPWYCYVPIYFAIFCTLCTVVWMVIAIISKCFRQLDG